MKKILAIIPLIILVGCDTPLQENQCCMNGSCGAVEKEAQAKCLYTWAKDLEKELAETKNQAGACVSSQGGCKVSTETETPAILLESYNFGRKRWYLADDADKRIQELEGKLRAARACVETFRAENAHLKACETELQRFKGVIRALIEPSAACETLQEVVDREG